MVAQLIPHAAHGKFSPGACIVDCSGALMRAYCRGDVTVVRVTGDIDATNIDRFCEYVNRFIRQGPGLILDLSGVEFLCAQGIHVLFGVDRNCRAAGTHWAVVGSPCVQLLLRRADVGGVLPIARSEPTAFDNVAQQCLSTPVAS